MPELTKVQKKLIDKVSTLSINYNCIVVLSKYSRNPYLYEYCGEKKPRISRISDKAFFPLQEFGIFESVKERVNEDKPVDMEFISYKLEEYLAKKDDEV